ncbi:MAG TPA: hypothetical protein VII32_16895 [Thermoanaerobaculia bacterium]|jgi:hypothetical protein
MKRVLLAMLLIAACKTAPPPVKEVPASALEDHSGDSMETAIAVPADAPNGGIDFENNWLFDRYGRFRRYFGGTGTANGRRYDVVKIELPNGEKKTVYFDITENWAAGTP